MNGLKAAVLQDRLLLPGETESGMYARVANFIADSVYTARLYYNAMRMGIFLPNSPTLMNAGTRLGQLSACFTVPVEDDTASIFDAVKYAALIHKSGGGTGFNFSRIRPKGSPVGSTAGVASGALSFMRLFDVATDIMKQGGKRRGANMGILNDDHAEIYDFINYKRLNPDQFQNFNLSVMITKKLTSDMRHEIAKNILACGDPGVLWKERINEDVPPWVKDEYGEIEATNPCLAGDTLMFTPHGLVRIKDWEHAWFSGVKQCITLKLSNGMELTCTPDHRIMLSDGTFVSAIETLGKRVKIVDREASVLVINDTYTLYGILFGNGYHCSNGRGISVSCDPDREPDKCRFLEAWGFRRQPCGEYYKDIRKLPFEINLPNPRDAKIPEEILTGYPDVIAGFLKGLFAANGSVIKTAQRITLKTVSKQLAKDVQVALSLFGIESYITETIDDTIYYSVNVSGTENINKFLRNIGILESWKRELLSGQAVVIREVCPKVVAIEDAGLRDVYDFKMPEGDPWNCANGIVVHNCAEQPLHYWNSCNLGSLNIGKFVEAGEVDWDSLGTYIEIAIDFLNAVIDKNKFPLLKIEEVTTELRPIGLGVMGFADALCKLSIRYDSPEAVEFARDLASFMKMWAREYSDSKGYENLTVLSIAPTGTLSIVAECSSGIEPHWGHPAVSRFFNNKMYTIKSSSAEFPDELVCTPYDVPWKQHIDIATAFQEFVDAGVSKTINMPHDTTIKEIEDALRYAEKKRLKGVTIYVDRSKDNVYVSKCDVKGGECG